MAKNLCKCKGFEFYKISKELRCSDLVRLKQPFQLLDQLPLCITTLATATDSSTNHTDPFAVVKENEDELEENELVLEDC